MKIYLGCDHAAFAEKEELKRYLVTKNIEFFDCGTYSTERCNYPDYADSVAKHVSRGDGLGLLLCGSGIGVSMVANRYQNIRAALCRSVEDAKLSRQHNDANVLCMGARTTSLDLLKDILDYWLVTTFEQGRHQERIDLFNMKGESVQ